MWPSMDGMSHGQLPKPNIRKTVKECSMCGDFGITTDLFQCRTCLSRFQHTYCSRSFPNMASEMWICNWCLHRNHREESKWKVKSVVAQAEQENDTESEKIPKSVLEMALQVSRVVVDAEAEEGCGGILVQSSSNSTGKIAKSSNKNNSGMENINDIRNRCHRIRKRQGDSYPQEKKIKSALEKRLPKITHKEMDPHLRLGKRQRYKRLSDFIC